MNPQKRGKQKNKVKQITRKFNVSFDKINLENMFGSHKGHRHETITISDLKERLKLKNESVVEDHILLNS